MACHAASKVQAYGRISVHTNTLQKAEAGENSHFVTTTREDEAMLVAGSVENVLCQCLRRPCASAVHNEQLMLVRGS